MNMGKTKEELLEELIRMQKDIEKKVEAQERLISKARLLIQNDGLFSSVVDGLPYPIAVFRKNGVLLAANHTFIKEMGAVADEISNGGINFLSHISDEFNPVLKAARAAFLGRTTMLSRAEAPLESLFGGSDKEDAADEYQNAVFFPVADSEGYILCGAVMLMK